MIRSNSPGSIFIPSISLIMILMSVKRMVYHPLRGTRFSGKNEFLNYGRVVPNCYSGQVPEVDIPFQSGSHIASRYPKQQLIKAGRYPLYGGRWWQLYLIGLIIFRILPDV
jgi:hypothetical protein